MKIIGKILAFFLVIILMLALPLSILAYDTGQVIFHAPLVKQILTDITTQSDLIPVGLQWYAQRRAQIRSEARETKTWQDEPDILELLDYLSIDEWRTIRHEVLGDEILQDWVSVTVDGTYAWIDSDQPTPDIQWNLALFKERVASEHGRNAIQVVFDTLDSCTEQQITDFKTRLAALPPGLEVPYNLCRFPDPWYGDQVSDYHNALVLVLANIPGTFNLTGALSGSDDTSGVGPDQIKLQLHLIRGAIRWAPLIPALLLLFVLMLAIRTLRELGNWWGIPLTLSGILMILLTLMYRSSLTAALSFGPLSETPTLVRTEVIQALLRLAVEIFRPMLWQSIVIGVLGIMLIAVGALIKPKTLELNA